MIRHSTIIPFAVFSELAMVDRTKLCGSSKGRYSESLSESLSAGPPLVGHVDKISHGRSLEPAIGMGHKA